MFARGSIFVAEKFKFSDGTTGKKLLVLLNNPTSGDPYLVVKTTSQKHSKPDTPGCIENYHQAYFILANSNFFQKDTWIQLDDYFPFDQSHVKTKTYRATASTNIKSCDQLFPENKRTRLITKSPQLSSSQNRTRYKCPG